MGHVEVALHIFSTYGTKLGRKVSPMLERFYLPKVPRNTKDTVVLSLIGG